MGRAQGKWHPWAMVSKQDSMMKDPIVIHNNGSYWVNLIVLVLYVYNLKVSHRNVSLRVRGCYIILLNHSLLKLSNAVQFFIQTLFFLIFHLLSAFLCHYRCFMIKTGWTFKTQSMFLFFYNRKIQSALFILILHILFSTLLFYYFGL